MVPITALWLPILVSAVIVFIASSIMHMVLPYHKKDFKRLPDEEGVTGALRTSSVAPGLYMFPHCDEHSKMKDPAVQEKFKRGPVGIVTIMPNGEMNIGKFLGLWFFYTLLVGLFTAYVTGLAVGPGTEYRMVFRIAGSAAFMSYALGYFPDSIWKGVPWGHTAKSMVDGLVYALLTAGTFGWLWPKG